MVPRFQRLPALLCTAILLCGLATRAAADPPPLDPDLSPYLAPLSESTYVANVLRLQSFVSRHTWSDSTFAVSNWLGGQFASCGYTDVRYDSLTAIASWGEKRVANVIAVKRGHLHPDREVIVCAHYDAHSTGTPLSLSPGVDDNASGVAAMLEMARVLAHVPLESTVLFVAFAAEEQGMQGSRHFADSIAARGDSVALVLNMDMIANFVTGDWRVWIHKDARSAALANTMAALATQYTSLVPLIDDATNDSDHWPFMAHGMSALEAEEHVRSGCWHRTCDVWGSAYSAVYAKQIVRMVMAQLLTTSPPYARTSVAAGGPAPSPGPAVTVRPLPGPGPFTIRYRAATAAPVAATILDVRGRVICELATHEAGASDGDQDGELQWNARDGAGRDVTAGIYFVHISGDSWSRTARIIVLR